MIQQQDILYGKISISGMPIYNQEQYTGVYTVTPKITQQTLNTAQKILKDNVDILSIPYYETTNVKGKTIIIGEV